MFLVLWVSDEGWGHHAAIELTWDKSVKMVHQRCLHQSYLNGAWFIHHGIVANKKGKLLATCTTAISNQGIRVPHWRNQRGNRIPDILKHKPKLDQPKDPIIDLAYKILQGDPIACDMARDILKI